jgi:hypothetical protein
VVSKERECHVEGEGPVTVYVEGIGGPTSKGLDMIA